MVLTLLLQLELWTTEEVKGPRPAVAALALVMAGALAWRRHRPLFVLCLSAAAFLVQETISGALSDMVTPFLTIVLAIYSATAYGSAIGRFAAGAVGLATTSVSVALDEGGADAASLIYAATVALVTWTAGLVSWQGGRRVSQLQTEAEGLIRERDEAARSAVEEERARVARELHDIIAHSVSVMRIQAAAAEEVFDEKPESARGALHSIQVVGRQALTDMRRLLILLRDHDEETLLEPQPAIGDLSSLLDQARESGLPVKLSVKGQERPLPAVVQLCVYRIVQESLTNALKHAGAAEAQVILDYRDREIAISVVDNGAGPKDGAGGHGLLGMRERVALLGGRFEADAGDHSGFVIRARVPLDPDVH